MPSGSYKKKDDDRKDKNIVAEIAATLEWLTTAFILAFVFRAFVMEAFRIPTGSMADTLKGAHFRLRCSQCGYEYDYGFLPRYYGLHQDTVPGYDVPIQPAKPRCPSCGYFQHTTGRMPVANGDRVLVLKCIYQLFEPKRWDVIVFKNPTDPRVNFIKRLVAKPGEEVEIIDGDIYINGEIERKPPKVQQGLWMPVYDNDYYPVQPDQLAFNGHQWRQPFRNMPSSKWSLDRRNPTIFTLESNADEEHIMIYDTSIGNDFRATYAYDLATQYKDQPYCSDLMVRFFVSCFEPDGQVGIGLSKYRTLYHARLDFTGLMVIEMLQDGTEPVELARKEIQPPPTGIPLQVKFANVDHQLFFNCGSEKLACDLGRRPEDAGPIDTEIQPKAFIFGSGRLTLSHSAIFRDIHYTTLTLSQRDYTCRAGAGNPLTLANDEFFVLGDNSPASADGRLWSAPGKGNGGKQYRPGIVPRDYLVGKALFVYWPSGFRLPWPDNLKRFLLKNSRKNLLSRMAYGIVSLTCIPNVGRVRLVYGGSEETL